MDASQTSEIVLKYVKKTNLNFNIVKSPFSFTVTIKNSFIKNQDGILQTSVFQESSASIDQQHSLTLIKNHNILSPEAC